MAEGARAHPGVREVAAHSAFDRDGDAPLRLAVLTRDCLYADRALRRLSASPALGIVALVRSVRPFRHRPGGLATLLEFNRRCGPRYAAHLVATSVPVPGLSRWHGLGRWARRLAVPLHSTGDTNGAPARAFLARAAPDLVLTVDFNHILRPDTLAGLPGARFFNVHPSLLPARRGHEPVFHGMLAGDEAFGVTVHEIVPELDAGAVLAQREVELGGLPLAERYARLFAAGAEAFAAAVEAHGRNLPTRPQAGEATRHTYPTRAQVRAFLAAGHRFS